MRCEERARVASIALLHAGLVWCEYLVSVEGVTVPVELSGESGAKRARPTPLSPPRLALVSIPDLTS